MLDEEEKAEKDARIFRAQQAAKDLNKRSNKRHIKKEKESGVIEISSGTSTDEEDCVELDELNKEAKIIAAKTKQQESILAAKEKQIELLKQQFEQTKELQEIQAKLAVEKAKLLDKTNESANAPAFSAPDTNALANVLGVRSEPTDKNIKDLGLGDVESSSQRNNVNRLSMHGNVSSQSNISGGGQSSRSAGGSGVPYRNVGNDKQLTNQQVSEMSSEQQMNEFGRVCELLHYQRMPLSMIGMYGIVNHSIKNSEIFVKRFGKTVLVPQLTPYGVSKPPNYDSFLIEEHSKHQTDPSDLWMHPARRNLVGILNADVTSRVGRRNAPVASANNNTDNEKVERLEQKQDNNNSGESFASSNNHVNEYDGFVFELTKMYDKLGEYYGTMYDDAQNYASMQGNQNGSHRYREKQLYGTDYTVLRQTDQANYASKIDSCIALVKFYGTPQDLTKYKPYMVVPYSKAIGIVAAEVYTREGKPLARMPGTMIPRGKQKLPDSHRWKAEWDNGGLFEQEIADDKVDSLVKMYSSINMLVPRLVKYCVRYKQTIILAQWCNNEFLDNAETDLIQWYKDHKGDFEYLPLKGQHFIVRMNWELRHKMSLAVLLNGFYKTKIVDPTDAFVIKWDFSLNDHMERLSGGYKLQGDNGNVEDVKQLIHDCGDKFSVNFGVSICYACAACYCSLIYHDYCLNLLNYV